MLRFEENVIFPFLKENSPYNVKIHMLKSTRKHIVNTE